MSIARMMQMAAAGVPYNGPMPTGTIVSSFSTPDLNPRGLAYDTSTGNMISGDRDTEKIYIHDGVSSTILSDFNSPSSSLQGLAYDTSTGNLISCDSASSGIYIHNGISSTILSSFLSPDLYPRGLAYDTSTGNLISCDTNSDLIYIHDGISSTILSSFASPSSNPTGLTYFGPNLVSYSFTSGLTYVHNGISPTILSSFAAPSSSAFGLTYDGTNLISCNVAPNQFFIHANVGDVTLDLTFYESAYGATMGPTNVYVVDSSGAIQGAAVYSRAAGDSGTPDWSLVTAATPVISGTFRIAWYYVSGSAVTGDYAIDTVTIQGVEYNFDTDNNGFVTTSGTKETDSQAALSSAISVPTSTDAAQSRWNRNTLGTPTNSTGPDGAQGGSHYLYTEASSMNQGNDPFWLFSPEITV
jgi:hypothetical protein|tara:strand:+ start:2664 stop:3902 length:1239 start_codon:yes stop_codon:yes gene_type:complete